MAKRLATGAFLALALVAAKALAGAMLTVTQGAGDSARTWTISEQAFHRFAAISFATRTDYTDGEALFSGPLAREVLGEDALRAARVAVMTAANDYTVEVPVEDLLEYDVIFATRMNGLPLSRRDKGPVWLMYPIDRHEELRNPAVNSRLIWQLERIELR